MAPAFLSFSSSSVPVPVPVPVARRNEASEVEMLRSKNEQLKRAVEESQRCQAELLAELEKTRMRLFKSEEAEERLCAQLGELEAESVEQARAYNHHINSLKKQLNLAVAQAQAQAQTQTQTQIDVVVVPAAREQVKRRN